jgi:Rrf2 family protein
MSVSTDLAIRALHELDKGGGDLTPGTRLTDVLEVSIHRVPQIMSPLMAQFWVESVPGPNGGYRLAADLEEISLLEVIEVVEGVIPGDRCVLRGAPCPSPEPCVLHVPWSRAREALMSELGRTPLVEANSSSTSRGG